MYIADVLYHGVEFKDAEVWPHVSGFHEIWFGEERRPIVTFADEYLIMDITFPEKMKGVLKVPDEMSREQKLAYLRQRELPMAAVYESEDRSFTIQAFGLVNVGKDETIHIWFPHQQENRRQLAIMVADEIQEIVGDEIIL